MIGDVGWFQMLFAITSVSWFWTLSKERDVSICCCNCCLGDRALQDEEMRSLIHSLFTFPATLATPQSAVAIAGFDRILKRDRSFIPSQLLQQCLPHLNLLL
jgi:hypothetical protein